MRAGTHLRAGIPFISMAFAVICALACPAMPSRASEPDLAGPLQDGTDDPVAVDESGTTYEIEVRAPAEDPSPDVARADDPVAVDESGTTYETEVHAPAELPIGLRTPGFAVSIDTTDSAAQVSDTAQILDRTTGVETRALGGLGSFASVSLRGSPSNQVLILLDGIPLSGSSFSMADINLVPPDLLGRIDVYRSGTPIWYGSSAMGGAVNMVTRDGHETAASVGLSYGSFGTRKVTAVGATGWSDTWEALAGITYLGSRGDFPFHDDRGTPYNPGDDVEGERRNNAFETVSGLLRIGVEPSIDIDVALQESFLFREQGLPGLGQNQSRQAAMDGYRSVSHLVVDAPGRLSDMVDINVALSADVQGSHLVDRAGEIGLGNQDHQTTLGLFAAMPRCTVYPVDWLDITTAAWGRIETYSLEPDASLNQSEASADRLLMGAAVEAGLGFLRRRLVLATSARVEQGSSAFDGELPFAYASIAPSPTRSDHLFNGQIGVRGTFTGGPAEWTIRANGGRFQRLPTFFELYGSQGSVIGNGNLTPESTLGADAGFTFELVDLPFELDGELALFAYHYEDLIQLVQNAQQVSRPENISQARVLGGEASLSWALDDWLSLVAGYTFTDAVDTSEVEGQARNRIPGRPRHSFSGQAQGRWRGAMLGYTLDADSGNALDRANYKLVPARVFHGAMIGYEPPWLDQWSLRLEVFNLFDQRVQSVPVLPQPPGIEVSTLQPVADFVGYPLPGRTLFATLRWESR